MQSRIFAAIATAAAATLVAAHPAGAAAGWALVPAGQLTPVGPLNAVSARTAADAWAVGTYPGPARHDGTIMLAERWNGRQWQQLPTPNVRFFDERLLAVHASAANDAWAVGATNQTSFATTNPIAAHWNGTEWTIVATPATTRGFRSVSPRTKSGKEALLTCVVRNSISVVGDGTRPKAGSRYGIAGRPSSEFGSGEGDTEEAGGPMSVRWIPSTFISLPTCLILLAISGIGWPAVEFGSSQLVVPSIDATLASTTRPLPGYGGVALVGD